MKKETIVRFIGLFVIVLFLGCSMSSPKRGMLNDYTYYSTDSPNIQIEINPNYEYRKGGLNQWQHQFWNKKEGKYIFINHFILRTLPKKYIWSNPHNWIFEYIPESNRIDKGTTTILGKKWYYRYIFKQFSNNCDLIKEIARFTESNHIFRVMFIKVLPSFNCNNWKNVSLITDIQKELANSVIEEVSNDAEIKNYISE